MTTTEYYQSYKERMQQVADVKHAAAVLQWDQETYLPSKGAANRGRQLATLSETAHKLFTDEKLGEILNELNGRADLGENEKRNVQLTLEDYIRNKKYSSEFVRKLTEQINRSFHSWIEARRKNSFSFFENDLSQLVELKKQETELLGYSQHPYNALLDEFEKACTVDFLDKVFSGLLPELKKLLDRIKQKPQVDDSFLLREFPKQQQWEWGMWLIRQLHFDFDAGRQDISEHPFTTSFGSTDVRVTTRINEKDFTSMTWSCIHEVGHALYEQGLPEDQYGLPLGEATSLGIHESQSRLWENNVGRSLSFWEYYYPALKEKFPQQLSKVSVLEFFKAINKTEPSLIRTEADELTYHFHVIIRYELEKKLIEGSIHTSDIPSFWNEHYEKYLGIKSGDDLKGCLQDVHWSHGSFGYFPTYTLGSLYAAEFFNVMQKNLPDVANKMKQGETKDILDWLRKNIHIHGRKFTSNQLCERITGQSLDSSYLVNYLLDKYALIYNL
jgi:carboxypeptidase Taq